MGKTNITTQQLDDLDHALACLYRGRVLNEPGQARILGQWRARWWHALHHVHKSSARPYAGRVMADLALELAHVARDQVEEMLTLLQSLTAQSRAQVEQLEAELEAARQEIARLNEELTHRPLAVSAILPAHTVTLKSELQTGIFMMVAETGEGRAWRIKDHVIEAGLAQNENGVRNAIKKVIGTGLLDDYRVHGRSVGFSITQGGSRRLVTLSDRGRELYRQVTGREPAPSVIDVAAQQHQSVEHGVAILEVRDYMRAAGYEVNDEPDAILADAQERWGARAEPDLIVMMEGAAWPVEVQMKASERFTTKWCKTLELAKRLAIVLPNQDQFKKQVEILELVELPDGKVRLACLVAMQSGEWAWHKLQTSPRLW